ncbi:hypothetical protein AAY473_018739 [Plecturocebus cupreus]
MAPTLALPDISKPFWLFVLEKQGVTKGVLTQTLGPWSQPVAYLSKRLDPVASGWPACLRSVAATALLVKKVEKLTLGQELNLVAPHAVESLLRGAPGKWMSNACIVQYQALLLDQPCIKFLKATRSPYTTANKQWTSSTLLTQPDLTDVPLQNSEEVLYTDGSSFMVDGVRYTGAAVVTLEWFVWAQALPHGT